MEKPRATYKNESFENATWLISADGEEGSRKYVTNCEKYDYIGSPTVEVRTLYQHILLAVRALEKLTVTVFVIISTPLWRLIDVALS